MSQKQVIPLFSSVAPYPLVKYLSEDELYRLIRANRATISRQGKARRAYLFVRPEDDAIVTGAREKIFSVSQQIIWELVCPATGAKAPRHKLTGRAIETYNEVVAQELANDGLFSGRKFIPKGALDVEIFETPRSQE